MTTHTPLLIIGTGFAGLGLAMKLKRQGDNDFIIIERSDDVGGTWRDNRYPGAACDVPSHLYSYSFKLKSDWSRVFAPATEIWEYMRWCAQDEGLMPHIHFNTNMLDCSWDETSKLWRVSTSQGEYTANVVVTAMGHLADVGEKDATYIRNVEKAVRYTEIAGRGLLMAGADEQSEILAAQAEEQQAQEGAQA